MLQLPIFSLAFLLARGLFRNGYDGLLRRNQVRKERASYSIDILPNEIFLCIAKHLTRQDCVTCMRVCKLWRNRFFEQVYGQVNLTQTCQVIDFYKVVRHTDHTLTETVSTLRLDYRVTEVIWTNFSMFQRIIVLCPNIKALDLSWWQLYFLLHPTHNDFRAVFHLRQLRELTIRSTYQVYRAVKRAKECVAVITGARVPQTDILFHTTELLLELIQHTPKLDTLSAYFHRLDDPWMTEKDLEAIHTYCPALRNLLLKNIILTQADHHANTYPVAEHMRSLTLGNIEFQTDARFFWPYLLRKYRNVSYAAIWQVRMQDEKAWETMMAGTSLWRNLHTFKFKCATLNTIGVCESFLTQIGSHIARLELGGLRRGDKRHRKFDAISVNVAWISKVCRSLKNLKLTYAIVYIDQETLVLPSKEQLGPGDFVTHLALERTSHVEPWRVQGLARRQM
ncbi:hypothetical protein BJV82DRAFT_594818 [Fennellomyces sp. T-0311]|nr:hypothetical protein BJV82DRAFT_594818 [Fennellomyces sp. T-0311]